MAKKKSRITLNADQTAAVDNLIEQIHETTGTRLARSHVIRALVAAMLDRKLDARLIRSEADLQALVSGLDQKVLDTLLEQNQSKPLDADTLSALEDAIK